MSDQQRFLAGLLLGAAAGAALALFLTSEKGKTLVAELKEDAETLGDRLRTETDEWEKQIEALLARGKTLLEEMEQKLKNAGA